MSDFKIALEVLKRRWFAIFAMALVAVGAALLAFKLAPHEFDAKTLVMLVGSSAGRDPSLATVDIPTVLFSDSVLSKVEADLNTTLSLDKFAKNIDTTSDAVAPGGAPANAQPNITPITFHAESPEMAVRGANAIGTELKQVYRRISASRYDDLMVYLDKAVAEQRLKVDLLNRRLELATASDPYVAQKDASTALATQMLGLDQQVALSRAAMSAHAAIAQVNAQHVNEIQPIVGHELLQNDPFYKNLADQVGKDSAQEQVVRAQFTDRFPGLEGLHDQVSAEKSMLATAAIRAQRQPNAGSPSYANALGVKEQSDAMLAGDKAQVAALEGQLQTVQAHLSHVPDLGVRVSKLRDERDAASTAYQFLAQQRVAALSDQAAAAALGSVVIVSPATIAEVSVGKHTVLTVIAAGLGFFILALMLPFLLELLDTRLRTRDSIESLYGAPLITNVGQR